MKDPGCQPAEEGEGAAEAERAGAEPGQGRRGGGALDWMEGELRGLFPAPSLGQSSPWSGFISDQTGGWELLCHVYFCLHSLTAGPTKPSSFW